MRHTDWPSGKVGSGGRRSHQKHSSLGLEGSINHEKARMRHLGQCLEVCTTANLQSWPQPSTAAAWLLCSTSKNKMLNKQEQERNMAHTTVALQTLTSTHRNRMPAHRAFHEEVSRAETEGRPANHQNSSKTVKARSGRHAGNCTQLKLTYSKCEDGCAPSQALPALLRSRRSALHHRLALQTPKHTNARIQAPG
jgi:hypothetical protein